MNIAQRLTFRIMSGHMKEAGACKTHSREYDSVRESERVTLLSRANTLHHEVIFSSHIITAVCQGNPIALDIKRMLVKISSLVEDATFLSQITSEEINAVLESDEFHEALDRIKGAIERALSLPILVARPQIRAECKELIDYLSRGLNST